MSDCCCCAPEITKYSPDDPYVCGEIPTEFGKIPKIKTEIDRSDKFGAFKVRCGIGRMDYKVGPGLYAVGEPDADSPVLVTCNYKLTFDVLRRELRAISAWILVLDTRGVNVWCAAGKGTFGTQELVSRIGKTHLAELVSHRNLILPQLGATGVSAHEVKQQTGFSVQYGPVRAEDLPAFLTSGITKEMRRVQFPLRDRAVLTPVEFLPKLKYLLMALGVMFVLNWFAVAGFGVADVLGLLVSLAIGCILVPIALPILPFRAFFLKGYLLGAIWAAAFVLLFPMNLLKMIGYCALLPTITAFCAMNFTGCTTFTSPSGVLKEMKQAIPIMIVLGIIGVAAVLVGTFLVL